MEGVAIEAFSVDGLVGLEAMRGNLRTDGGGMCTIGILLRLWSITCVPSALISASIAPLCRLLGEQAVQPVQAAQAARAQSQTFQRCNWGIC
eukprot:2129316-Amphidinium_carterae.1